MYFRGIHGGLQYTYVVGLAEVLPTDTVNGGREYHIYSLKCHGPFAVVSLTYMHRLSILQRGRFHFNITFIYIFSISVACEGPSYGPGL